MTPYLLSLLLALPAAADPPVGFKADVAPILVSRCLGCHNDRKAENGLNMKTIALLKKGGKAGGADTVVAGDPDASYLVEVIRPGAEPRMPLKEAPLSAAEIAVVERWIAGGAKLDDGVDESTPIASLVDPLRNLPKVATKVPVSDPVTSLAFSKDGVTLAAAVGKSLILFDLGKNAPTATLADHPGPVSSVAITPDGKTLVASGGRAGQFGFVTVWDLATKSRRHDLRGHTDAILAADLGPDGTTLATASYDRTVKLWDIAKGAEVRTLKEHTDAVHAVAFSRDGRRLATGGADRTVKVWDVATGGRIVSLSDSTGEVYAVAFSATGTTLYAGGVDRLIRSWELEGRGARLLKSTFAHKAPVLRLAVTPDGTRIVSTGEDKQVEVWSLPGLDPRASLGVQPDWPQALAIRPDGEQLAIGRYDGSIALVGLATGATPAPLRSAPTAPVVAQATKPKPALVRGASLAPPSPRGGERGKTVRVTLTGNGVGKASTVTLDHPGLVATIVAPEKPDPNRLAFDLAIGGDVPPGPHRVAVQTPLGIPAAQTFLVSEFPEVAEMKANDDPKAIETPVAAPAMLVGTIEAAGDVDAWRFAAKAGDDLVFEAITRPIGSTIDPVLTLLDASGRTIARAVAGPHQPDPVLAARVEGDGPVTLVVSDAQYGGSGNHVYRIKVGQLPRLVSAFPLGVARGGEATVALRGVNLGTESHKIVAGDRTAGAIVPVVEGEGGRRLVSSRSIVVAEGVQSREAEPNDAATSPTPIAAPGGASGTIVREGDVDFYAFEAKKGRTAIVEVFGRRLGSPIDPVVEILDAMGKPVPRAVLRPVEETNVAFRDHPSTGRNIRLTKWDYLRVDDYLLVGRELMRLAALPRNPDDDAIMWGLGNERNNQGERIAFLETTPEHHPLGQPMVKVEIHPPGTTFPAGGMAPITLPYRNDDGGPGFGKDARVTFDPPADGTYLIRVEDVRGLGGDDFGYHVVVRSPRPDFAASLSSDDPDVPRGGAAIVRVNLARIDGFDGAIEVTPEGLPPGVTATTAVVEAGAFTADLLLMADADAPTYSPPTWRVVARSAATSSGEPIRHEIDPGGPLGGRITVTPEPDLKVSAHPDRVVIRPGERVEMTLAVERGAAFAGRVPIDVRNLPLGVRVLNIGLNGVLVTESQTSRSIFLYAEPWVEPTDRPFYAVGRVEASSSDSSSPPIRLIVAPPVAGTTVTGSRP